MKILIEIYKILARLGIKPKDIIGIGGNIQKMGKSLYNNPISQEALLWIAKNRKLPAKFIEEIKLTARTLKNSKPKEQEKFLQNLKEIEKSKNPSPIKFAQVIKLTKESKSPVPSVKKPESVSPLVDKILQNIEIAKTMSDVKKAKDMAFAKGEIEPKITNKNALDTESVLKMNYNENNEFANAKGVARYIIMNSDYLSDKQKKDLSVGKDPIMVFEEIYGTKATKNIPNENSTEVAKAYGNYLNNIKDNRGRGSEDPEFDRETINIDFNTDELFAHGGIANHFRRK
tara:strand:+ start:661 stop:1521 length:861 start_codon:yes stop_codon:yes gene_type:complete